MICYLVVPGKFLKKFMPVTSGSADTLENKTLHELWLEELEEFEEAYQYWYTFAPQN